MNEKLLNLLNKEAERIDLEFKEASISGSKTPSDVSDRREPHISAFVEKYFPFPYRIAKGRIIDSYGKESNSIDCVLLNPTHPYTINPASNHYALLLADGVDAVVEVKPKLEGDEIIRALKQIQSVKILRRVNTILNQGMKRSSTEQVDYSKQIASFIFSTSTYSNLKFLIEKIVKYYTENSVPKNEQFDYIVINNRCIIYNSRFNSVVNNNRKVRFNEEAICFVNHGDKTLFHFLFRLNTVFPCVLPMSESVIYHYLDFSLNADFQKVETYPDLNEKLLSIADV